ncbi:GIY-YIG nuclease family protein [Bradyrhizobium denitrificans]|uniref:GIY-YIG nuclease family protein n=1 Tax=Bradyrhizobium denitrificans TaxID=2734912 RepID=UPI00039B8F72|nr:GIY-YIG nuclease family protein [Bradyrhizobium denitrificans]MCL8489068.1 GIY-YIG nuclease family protein [Bradyrhizobium denitrificans]
MSEPSEDVEALSQTLEHLGAPDSLPEDWIILCDADDLRDLPRAAAKRLLAKAKKETAHRWLWNRFHPAEMEQELSDDDAFDDTDLDDRQLKQHAIKSIDDVASMVQSLRERHANIPAASPQSSAHAKTVAARLQYGYPAERPARSDCFDEDVRRQCRRVINAIYSTRKVRSAPLVYLISTDNPEFVKIGFTTCLERRLSSLRTASHVEPTVHLTIQGPPSLERELHARFAASRHNREWFRLTDDIRSFIASQGAR